MLSEQLFKEIREALDNEKRYRQGEDDPELLRSVYKIKRNAAEWLRVLIEAEEARHATHE